MSAVLHPGRGRVPASLGPGGLANSHRDSFLLHEECTGQPHREGWSSVRSMKDGIYTEEPTSVLLDSGQDPGPLVAFLLLLPPRISHCALEAPVAHRGATGYNPPPRDLSP